MSQKIVTIHLLQKDFEKLKKILKICSPDLKYLSEDSEKSEADIYLGIDKYL